MEGNGEPGSTAPGFAIHLYACNKSMGDVSFTNADGDFLIVPQTGTLKVTTEFGVLTVKPTEICVVMRGMRFSVDVEGPSRGYVCELFQRHFTLPELGPIGSNGLANPQDFEMRVQYEDREDIDYEVACSTLLVCRSLWMTRFSNNSLEYRYTNSAVRSLLRSKFLPFNVVA